MMKKSNQLLEIILRIFQKKSFKICFATTKEEFIKCENLMGL